MPLQCYSDKRGEIVPRLTRILYMAPYPKATACFHSYAAPFVLFYTRSLFPSRLFFLIFFFLFQKTDSLVSSALFTQKVRVKP